MLHTKRLHLLSALVLALSCSASNGRDRSYVSGNFFLTLDGVKCGFLKSVDGGSISAEVVAEPGSGAFVAKHLGKPRYGEFTLSFGLSMDKSFFEWIAQSWRGEAKPRTGAITALDYTLTPKSERRFENAIITSTTIPAMDGSSKEPAYMTVTISPATARNAPGTGTKADYATYGKDEQKVMLPSNFKLEIDGIDCSRVNRIESFTVGQSVGNDPKARETALASRRVNFPNLKLTLPDAASPAFLRWHESYVVEGNAAGGERNGMLTIFAPSQQGVLLRIKLYNVGICSLEADKAEANADQVKRVEVELYVERMELLFGEAAATAARVGA
ncbi:MAG: phage tail protein [Solirubrobacterales bacterium]